MGPPQPLHPRGVLIKFMNIKKNNKKQAVTAVVSGGFDPLHVGHVRLFQDAKKHCDRLIILLNNDHWLKLKKGFVFMPQKERKELIEGFKWVDKVMLTTHKPGTKDISVCADLKRIKPDIFIKGGDRTYDNIPEVALCESMGCKMIFNVGRGGKIQSSSWLLERFRKS